MSEPTEQQVAALDEIIHFATKNAEAERSNDHQSAWYEHARKCKELRAALSAAPPRQASAMSAKADRIHAGLLRIDWAGHEHEHAANDIAAARLIRELSEQPAPRQAEGWQPISSAPKDGTSIQIKGRQGPYGVLAWEGCAQWGRPVNWHKDDSTWLEPGTGAVLALAGYRPTHWQPLPEPKRSDDGEPSDQRRK